MRKRPIQQIVRLNEKEHQHLIISAELAGLSKESFIRKLIMGENLRPRPPDAYAALLRELSAIGNNINQLAHQANARGEATRAEIHAASELVQQAWRIVREAV